ncbi:acyltransferase [Fusibacter sp. JL298sf-3]
MSSSNRKRLEALDVTRGIAILAVVLIHTTAPSVALHAPGTASFNAIYTLNRLLQFAVPLFIMISAIVATYAAEDIHWPTFYNKKWLRIAVPYLVWSLIYIVKNLLTRPNYIEKLTNVGDLAFIFLMGKAHPHLYYLSVLMQFFICFPLILMWVRRTRLTPLQWTAVAALLQIGIYWLNRLVIYEHFKYPASLYIWYLFISLIGAYIGHHYEALKVRWHDYKRGIISLAVTSGALNLALLFRFTYTGEMNTFYQLMVWYVFVTTASLCIIALSEKIHQNLKPLSNGLSVIGTYAFGIYLVHPLILMVAFRARRFLQLPLKPSVVLCIFAGTVFLALGHACATTHSSLGPTVGAKKGTVLLYRKTL